MKKGKELKVNCFKNYNVVYGSVNNKNPKALYINISAWAEPKNDSDINYNRIIRDMDKKIRQAIYNHLDASVINQFVKERTIIDFDIKESGVRFGKRSFTNCEITLYMKNEIPVNSEILRPDVDEIIQLIIESVFQESKYFKFYRKKN
ncbi:MAG: hypothetical protein HQL93_08085 [Magnetococcales bacterium]|nr:hypothetical protein [Magnetococcales bacterium]